MKNESDLYDLLRLSGKLANAAHLVTLPQTVHSLSENIRKLEQALNAYNEKVMELTLRRDLEDA